LEADLYSIVYQGYGKQPFSVYDYVYHLWTQDKTNPWEEVISIVRWGLVRRNLLIAEEKRSLKIFVSYRYQISEDQRSWVSQIPIQPVQQLISNASIQPDKWKMLTKEISKALHARQEKSESDLIRQEQYTMPSHAWVTGFPGAITVCDRDGIIWR